MRWTTTWCFAPGNVFSASHNATSYLRFNVALQGRRYWMLARAMEAVRGGHKRRARPRIMTAGRQRELPAARMADELGRRLGRPCRFTYAGAATVTARVSSSARATSDDEGGSPNRTATSNPSATRSPSCSRAASSSDRSGWRARNAGDAAPAPAAKIRVDIHAQPAAHGRGRTGGQRDRIADAGEQRADVSYRRRPSSVSVTERVVRSSSRTPTAPPAGPRPG